MKGHILRAVSLVPLVVVNLTRMLQPVSAADNCPTMDHYECQFKGWFPVGYYTCKNVGGAPGFLSCKPQTLNCNHCYTIPGVGERCDYCS